MVYILFSFVLEELYPCTVDVRTLRYTGREISCSVLGESVSSGSYIYIYIYSAVERAHEHRPARGPHLRGVRYPPAQRKLT